jgi:hypothetical protein
LEILDLDSDGKLEGIRNWPKHKFQLKHANPEMNSLATFGCGGSTGGNSLTVDDQTIVETAQEMEQEMEQETKQMEMEETVEKCDEEQEVLLMTKETWDDAQELLPSYAPTFHPPPWQQVQTTNALMAYDRMCLLEQSLAEMQARYEALLSQSNQMADTPGSTVPPGTDQVNPPLENPSFADDLQESSVDRV